ncbi:mRNA-degrading endonuclease [Spirochaetia bacterium]|nr:mRNA-degrading endonuclease [Spirochaetia bacterium]
MVKEGYIPERGDIVWLDFDPQKGHEQKGNRPAIVISPKEYNEKVGLAIFCPITSQKKGYPFEVKIVSKKITGVILSDQIKSFDWRKRDIKFITKSKDEEMAEVVGKINVLLNN